MGQATVFLKDGRLELDNNRSEHSIKPVVIGRNRRISLPYLFTRLPDLTNDRLNTVLPWSEAVHAACRVPVAE